MYLSADEGSDAADAAQTQPHSVAGSTRHADTADRQQQAATRSRKLVEFRTRRDTLRTTTIELQLLLAAEDDGMAAWTDTRWRRNKGNPQAHVNKFQQVVASTAKKALAAKCA